MLLFYKISNKFCIQENRFKLPMAAKHRLRYASDFAVNESKFDINRGKNEISEISQISQISACHENKNHIYKSTF